MEIPTDYIDQKYELIVHAARTSKLACILDS